MSEILTDVESHNIQTASTSKLEGTVTFKILSYYIISNFKPFNNKIITKGKD